MRAPRLLLALCVAVFATAAAAASEGDGASSLVIAYHVAPADRPAWREAMQQDGITRFEAWKAQGVLRSYLILANRYVDSANWDFLAVLTFSGPAGLESWTGIEKKSPAGLPQKALALTRAIDTTPAGLDRHAEQAATAMAGSVFLVIPYQVMVPTADYLTYLDGYAIPQFDGWMKEGNIGGWEIHLARYAPARPWASLLLLRYVDQGQLAAREAVVAKVRARLKDDPTWKAISDGKKNVRAEQQIVVADPLGASP
jgi:hypothetical protein